MTTQMTRMLSITSMKEDDGEELQTSRWRLFMRLAQLSKPEVGYNLLGLLGHNSIDIAFFDLRHFLDTHLGFYLRL